MATTTFSSSVVAKGGVVTSEQLPANTTNGAASGSIAVFDLGGSKVLAYSDGTNWINVTTGEVIPVGPAPAQTTYLVGPDYASASFAGMGTSGYINVSGSTSAMLAAMQALTVGSAMVLQTATLTVNATVNGPSIDGEGLFSISVQTDTSLMGDNFISLTF